MHKYIFIFNLLLILLIQVLSSKVNVLIDELGDLKTNNSEKPQNSILTNYFDNNFIKNVNNNQLKRINYDTSNEVHEFVCQCKIFNNCISYKECYGLATGIVIIILIFILSIGFLVQYLSLAPCQYLSNNKYTENQDKKIKRCCFTFNAEVIIPTHPKKE